MKKAFHRDILLAGCAALAFSPASHAQEEKESVLSTVVVTAQRSEESIQSVPIAIAAMDGDMMKDQGIVDIGDLALNSPGVSFKTDFGNTNPNVFIRGVGIGDFNANVTSAVGIYVDDVYVASPAAQLFQFFDAERVEILKGPQGTLYGRNTTGGAINFISRKPSDSFESDLYAEYGNYNAFSIDAGIGGPIVSNVLNGRISGVLNTRDGITDNNAPVSLAPDKVNDVDNWGGRGQLEFMPSDNASFLLTVFGGANDSTALQNQYRGLRDPVTGASCSPIPSGFTQTPCVDFFGYGDADGDLFAIQIDGRSKEEIAIWGTSLKGEFELGDYFLTSITAYQDADRRSDYDGDNAPVNWLGVIHDADSHQFSQELRLQSPAEDRFRWLLGSFYFEENLEFQGEFDLFRAARPFITAAAAGLTPDQLAAAGSPGNFVGGYNPFGGGTLAGLLGNPAFGFPAQIFKYNYDQDVSTWAVFGQSYYDWTDDITLTVGLRYSEEERSFDYASQSAEPGLAPITIAQNSAALGNNEKSFSDLSYRVALEWQAKDDLFSYVSYTKGSKSGGFNGSLLLSQLQTTPFDDETVSAFEVGVKADWLNGRLRTNASTFFYQYDDMQVYILANFGPVSQQILTNAANAEIKGFELETLMRPIDPLEISASVTVLDTEFKEFFTGPGTGAPVQDFSGNQLTFTPELSAALGMTYTHPLSSGAELVFGGNVTYQDETFIDPANSQHLATDSYTLLGLRAAYRAPGGNWELGIWGRNVTDEEYIIQQVDGTSFGRNTFQLGMPQTYGVSLRVNY